MGERNSPRELAQKVAELEAEILQLKAAKTAFNRQNASLKALHETSLGLIDTLGREAILDNILERAVSLSGSGHGYIYLLDSEHDRMRMVVGKGFFKGQLGRVVARGEGIGGRVWRDECPLVVANYQSWDNRIADRELDQLRSIVGIPLKYRDRVLGVIGLAYVEEGERFTEEDVVTLERFAALALIALEKARLYGGMQHELLERKKAEAILRQSENRYRTFLESSPDPIVVYDMDGIATYVNPAFEQTFKLSRGELLGKQIDFVPEESWPETRKAILRLQQGQKIHLFETKRLTRDGKILDVQLSSTLYQDSDGNPLGNIVTLRDISARKKAEQELDRYRGHLEELVRERTALLAKANMKLELEVDERKRAEKALRTREKELKAQSHHLEEVNTALRVLLKQREEDRKELGETVLKNVEELVVPYLRRVGNGQLNSRQKTLLGILETNLNNILTPFSHVLSQDLARLTPVEIRVASLVKTGKTNKEIAEILLVSKNTILFHRYNIRRKLGIKNKKINLCSHLLSLEK
ncbi:PAS domain S-box protein [Desulforhopalus singaporensis]|uniref:PAS domain S-box-containing protein n=1 Tax=Desulforhopalus singaporensis TaxID=91360 RepID=A0A1H0LBV7_9BACT|nr:PAS domain S-box protein [Desulforhopalus singaporensis]SDO65503.1 PAS domain S-box-containing protein [Desulforhopalus singaporensis]